MSTVLVVDDEHRIRVMLCRLLSADGHRTVTAADGSSALARLRSGDPVDLVLLDLALPRLSGLGVLETAGREGLTAPVIVLSAVEDVAARVRAFELGAVDFVGKPFHTAELVARVRRTLAGRQEASGRPKADRHLEGGGIRLDLERRRALLRSAEVPLTSREFALLAHLMRRQGHVCRRDELLHDVWGTDDGTTANVVEACVRRLRRKLEDLPVETVRSVGYCFVGDG